MLTCELKAARLYTGPLFDKYNTALRALGDQQPDPADYMQVRGCCGVVGVK
jgi:hypothetical protein